MRLKPNFELQQVCGENVIIAQGRENIDYNRIITLNESAALIWRAAEGRDFEVEDLVNVLLDEYEVDAEQARQDIDTILAQWHSADLL